MWTFRSGSDVRILVSHMHAQQMLLLTGAEDPFYRVSQCFLSLHQKLTEEAAVAA